MGALVTPISVALTCRVEEPSTASKPDSCSAANDMGVAMSPSIGGAYARALSLLHLHLHRLARLCRRPNSDNQIPLRRRAGALCNLTDRTDGVDDGGACRIRHEPSERFQSPSAFWIIGERQHEWLLGRQSGHRGLHHL